MIVPGTKKIMQLKATNADILNAIRVDSSELYAQRIPAADQGDITATVQALWEFKPQMNEFLDALVNRIGDVVFKSKTWSNPLAPFKRGMMRYGDTIEEIGTTLLEAQRQDSDKCYEDVFKCTPPEIVSNFHYVNRQDRYDLTITEPWLRRAFLSDYGLQDLVGRIMQTPYTSDYWDEYLIMKNLFKEYDKVDGFYKVQVPDPAGATTADERRENSLAITEQVRALAGRMKFLSARYNSAGIPTWTAPSDLVLFCTPEFTAMLDVNVLAFAFNASAADLNVRVVEIDDFGIDGAVAILADRDFFMCADTLISFDSIRNPKALSWNYFLHHWGLYSVSRFVNAVLFTTESQEAITVPTITVTSSTVAIAQLRDGTTPEFAEKGGKLRLTATVAGTVAPETPGYEVPQGVVWSITGTSGKPLSQGTFVTAEGVLHVDPREQNTWVEVTATTTYLDPNNPISGQTYKSGKLNVGIGSKYEAA